MEQTLRISGLSNDSIVDGPGLRFVIFTQGCDMHCEGCHNPSTWDKNGGYEVTFDEILSKIKANPLLDGVTLSGGEPFLQAKALTTLVKLFPENLNVICYTGYTYEYLLDNANEQNGYKALLDEIDTLIDGEFIESQKSYDLNFKGSRNQRSIDVKASMENKKIILV